MAGNRVAECRRAAGLTQRGLADLAGVTDQTISNIERGNKPDVQLALAIARALGSPVEALFCATGGVERRTGRRASKAAVRAYKGTHAAERTSVRRPAGKSRAA